MTAPSDFPGDALEVGRVVEAWGLKGWIRVQPYSLPPLALLASRRWYLRASEGVSRPATLAASLPPVLEISEVKEHGEGLVAASKAIADRTAAEALRGARIFIARASFPAAADDDEFYWADLIGLDVVNREGVGLGTVVGLIDTGPQSVLRVQAEAAEERLIPFVSAYVDSVDLAARRLIVDWGLDY